MEDTWYRRHRVHFPEVPRFPLVDTPTSVDNTLACHRDEAEVHRLEGRRVPLPLPVLARAWFAVFPKKVYPELMDPVVAVVLHFPSPPTSSLPVP